MAASADLSAMSDDEVQKMLAARTEELRKLKEEVAQQDAAKAKPAKAEAALAQQPAQLSFKDWWPFPIPQRAPSWGIFVLPFYLVFNSWGEMSKLTTAAIILCTCISTYFGQLFVEYCEDTPWRRKLREDAEKEREKDAKAEETKARKREEERTAGGSTKKKK